MKYIDNNMILNYEKYGHCKPTILILPGWGNTRPTFNFLIDNLKEQYTIYIIDNPPFNKSKLLKDLTIYDYTESIYNFIKKENIENPIIISHSFGGRISTLLTTKYNLKINKLILIDIASIKPHIKIKTYLYKILMFLSSLLPYKNKIKNYLFNKFSSDDYKELKEDERITFKNIVNEDLTRYIKQIKVETLILWGDNDTSTPLYMGKKINKYIKDSALIIFKNCNHFPYLTYPYQTLNIILSFIKNREP